MSKLQLFGVSLVAAVPGGFLAYLMAMNFLQIADKMDTMFQILAGSALFLSALIAVLPAGILIFGPKSESAEGEKLGKKEKKKKADDSVEAIPTADVAEMDDAIPEDDLGEIEVDDAQLSGDDFATDDLASIEEDEILTADGEFDDFEEEEENA